MILEKPAQKPRETGAKGAHGRPGLPAFSSGKPSPLPALPSLREAGTSPATVTLLIRSHTWGHGRSWPPGTWFAHISPMEMRVPGVERLGPHGEL